MLGGFLFASANVKMVPILKTIGIGMGTSIRASTGIVIGWVSARLNINKLKILNNFIIKPFFNLRYGIFGTKPEYPNNLIENYFGVALSVMGALLFLLVKPSVTNSALNPTTENQSLLSNTTTEEVNYQAIQMKANDIDEGKLYLTNLSPLKKRILGVTLSITAGIAVGLAYVPYLYVVDRFDNVSKNGLDYIFSMFTGDLISVFTYFVCYCIFKKNRPYVNREAILPGCVNGWIWGIGACCFQFSNSVLSQAVTFPIALGLQSLMGVVYGVFLFKEICGITNFIILSMGFTATVIGSALCGISKY